MAENMKYGTEEFAVHLAPEQIAAELEANRVDLPQEPAERLVRRALANPIDSRPLGKIVHPGETVCIIISDVTRRWQSPEIYIPLLVEELEKAGVQDRDMLILSATGTHRPQTKEEHIGLVTEAVYNRIRVEDHQCDDVDNLLFAGITTRDTPVWLDKRAVNCDRIILTGGVVYHFMAGYGGGRKSILPGIAGRETIMKNHSLALNAGLGSGSNPQVRSANLSDANPVHADMVEACAMVKPDFLLNVVVDDNQKIVGAFAGDWRTAHRAACFLVDRMYGVAVHEKTPLVIASAGGFPKDLNFYQTVKTLCNAVAVAEDGGTVILVTRSDEGFGSAECEKQIAGYATMEEREKALRADFSIGAYIGYLFAECAEKYHLIAVTGIPQSQFGTANIHAVSTLDEALNLAWQLNGGRRDLRATLLPHGANTLPKLV
jgi:nickel-dependent lactate racemase